MSKKAASPGLDDLLAVARKRRPPDAELFKIPGLFDWVEKTMSGLAADSQKYRGQIKFTDIYEMARSRFGYTGSHQSMRDAIKRNAPSVWADWEAFRRGA